MASATERPARVDHFFSCALVALHFAAITSATITMTMREADRLKTVQAVQSCPR
jgi:hypothetical protein